MLTYLINLGLAFDMGLNAILGGQPGQTISMRAALARQAGERWGCIVCRLLSWLVQRNHCADQLAGVPMSLVDRARALIGLLALAWLLEAPIWLLCRVFAKVAWAAGGNHPF